MGRHRTFAAERSRCTLQAIGKSLTGDAPPVSVEVEGGTAAFGAHCFGRTFIATCHSSAAQSAFTAFTIEGVRDALRAESCG